MYTSSLISVPNYLYSLFRANSIHEDRGELETHFNVSIKYNLIFFLLNKNFMFKV